MATMHPRHLPQKVRDNRKLKGEIDTFNALAKLPDEFDVFYNRFPKATWTTQAHEPNIDFIIIHERLGLLAMEVKGGKIRVNEGCDFKQYISKTKSKPIAPFDQVRKALISMIRVMKEDGVNYWIQDNVCVLFPHTYRQELTSAPEQLPAATLCADEMKVLPTIIPKLFSKPKKPWKSDEYIDVKRRLSAMPQAERKYLTKEENQSARKNDRNPKYEGPKVYIPPYPYSVETTKEEPTTPKKDVPIGTIRSRQPRAPYNHDPVTNIAPLKKDASPKKTSITWQEALWLMITFAATFFVIFKIIQNI